MFIKIIPQSHCLIVERFGKPVRVAHSGLNFFIPFIDGVKNVSLDWNTSTNKNGIFIELTEQINDTQPRQYITKDNVTIEVDCVYRWRITDPMKAVYEVDNLHKSLKETPVERIGILTLYNDPRLG